MRSRRWGQRLAVGAVHDGVKLRLRQPAHQRVAGVRAAEVRLAQREGRPEGVILYDCDDIRALGMP